jgi:hypothetical protein
MKAAPESGRPRSRRYGAAGYWVTGAACVAFGQLPHAPEPHAAPPAAAPLAAAAVGHDAQLPAEAHAPPVGQVPSAALGQVPFAALGHAAAAALAAAATGAWATRGAAIALPKLPRSSPRTTAAIAMVMIFRLLTCDLPDASPSRWCTCDNRSVTGRCEYRVNGGNWPQETVGPIPRRHSPAPRPRPRSAPARSPGSSTPTPRTRQRPCATTAPRSAAA